MAFVDLLALLIVVVLIIYVVVPAIRKVSNESTPLSGDLGTLEQKVKDAADAREKANEVIQTAKHEAEETLHKVEDLTKKL